MKNVKPVPKTTWKTQRNQFWLFSQVLWVPVWALVFERVFPRTRDHTSKEQYWWSWNSSMQSSPHYHYFWILGTWWILSVRRTGALVKPVVLNPFSWNPLRKDEVYPIQHWSWKRHWTSRSRASERKEASYLGKRCRGHGMKRNSCGTDSRKLMIWGIKNSSMVLLKWPMIPTTAKVIPAK